MAFLIANFSSIGGQARSGNAPAHWSYESATDSLAVVQASGYFDELAADLNAGDFIMLSLTDGKFLITVASVTVAPGVRLVVIDSSSFSTELGGALVFRTTNRIITSGESYIIEWNGEIYDDKNIHDNSTENTKLIMPAGVSRARFFGSIVMTYEIDGVRKLDITVDQGSAIGIGGVSIEPTSNTNQVEPRIQIFSAVVPVLEGEEYELVVFQDSTQSLSLQHDNGHATFFGVEFIE